MHSMDYFFRLQQSQEDDTSDHELLRKKAEELEAALILVRNQKEQELSLLKARSEASEAQLSWDALEAQAKISNLEAIVVTNNATIQSLKKELSSAKIQAEIESRASEVRILHSLEEATIQRSKAKGLKTHLHRAKEQLRKYKEKARSFYKQLTFASWVQDSGFHVGYMEGIESLRSWVQKLGNFPKVDKVSVEELLPPNRIVKNMLLIGQEEMPDCRGIKDMGFDPHFLYNRDAQAKAKISHGEKRQGDSEADSTGLINFSAESWDNHPDKDSTGQQS
jgi:hypothetical protein